MIIHRRVLSGRKNGSSAPTPTSGPRNHTDDSAGQPVDSGAGTGVYYDYIQPLNPVSKSQLPQSSNAHLIATNDTVEVRKNFSMTENYSYDRVSYNSSDQETAMSANAPNPESVPGPPIPPRNSYHVGFPAESHGIITLRDT